MGSKSPAPGSIISMSDEGEGWFRGYPSKILGRVAKEIRITGARNPYLLLVLEEPMFVQYPIGPVSGHVTIPTRFSQVLVSSRWLDRPIRENDSVSSFLFLLPSEEDPEAFLRSRRNSDFWAMCEVECVAS